MSGGSPVGIAENGTRSGKESFDGLSMCMVFPNLPSCLPSLVRGLVPRSQRYYEGSESSAKRIIGLHTAEASLIISIELPSIPSPSTLLPFHSPRFDTLLFLHRASRLTVLRCLSASLSRDSSGTWSEVRASRFARTLADRLGRIEFT